jgi:hypothetical protein
VVDVDVRGRRRPPGRAARHDACAKAGACAATPDTARRADNRSARRLCPGYAGACLDAAAADYDCAGGSGDGPEYTGEVRVVGEDHFDLDRDGDGVACEPS